MEATASVPILGRKIFLLNVANDLSQEILNYFREREFEIFLIDDYRDAKTILRRYPGSMIFVQPDYGGKGGLSESQWFNFLLAVETAPDIHDILKGIIAKRMSSAALQFFSSNLNLDAGVFSVRSSLDDCRVALAEIFERKGAKGRRRYVRARCPRGTINSFLKCTIDGQSYTFFIDTLSTVGFSCIIPTRASRLFSANMMLHRIKIVLNGRELLHQCNATVFTVRPFDESNSVIVLILMQSTSLTIRHEIRRFVFETLETDLKNLCIGAEKDDTIYPSQIILHGTEMRLPS